MVNNMNNMKETKEKLEKIFFDLGIKFTYLDGLNDDDLNYELLISSTGVLKPLKLIHCICYYNFESNTINIIVPNIYKISRRDDVDLLYKIVNDANLHIDMGSFSIFENEKIKSKQIVYRTTYKCGENLDNLTKLSFDEQIKYLLSNILYIFYLLKKGEE